ncbi:MAG: glycosyltransferase [Acidobacteriaceae bacterium]|nr:glycosyltransferase [Acidobacteriaceae bacterium]
MTSIYEDTKPAAAHNIPRLLSRPVVILIPAYGAADRLRTCLKSLAADAPRSCSFYVIDDGTPNDNIAMICEETQAHLPELRYIRSDVNRGFVRTCNLGMEHFCPQGSDLLLLNSDVEVTPDFLNEMQAVLDLHEKHAVVTPRSNNATIFSIPFAADRLPPADSFALWRRLKPHLPRYYVMPTAVGFCMLIKSTVLERFGLFDDVYGFGYNEENDYVCRINRFGYSAVSANWAFVFHHEMSSFGQRRADLERRNRAVLLTRYPEYERKVHDYCRLHADPIEIFAPLYCSHRPRILYDLFHVSPIYNGTTEFALNLLRELPSLLGNEYELHVGMKGEPLEFFSSELRGHYLYTDDAADATGRFDLVFKPGQVFTLEEFRRMNRLAPRVAYTLQDIIGVRCEYLNSAYRRVLFKRVAELSDRIFTISDSSRSDFRAFYDCYLDLEVIYHGTTFTDTNRTGEGDYILLVGNHYFHKGIAETLLFLKHAGPIVVLGSESHVDSSTANVRWLVSGQLTKRYVRSLFARAKVIIYPSHYEGFGLPVMDALALGKPVIALDTAVNRELAAVTRNPNLHLVSSVACLSDILKRVTPIPTTIGPVRTWCDAARQYVNAFKELLGRDIDVVRLRARWDFLRSLEALQN